MFLFQNYFCFKIIFVSKLFLFQNYFCFKIIFVLFLEKVFPREESKEEDHFIESQSNNVKWGCFSSLSLSLSFFIKFVFLLFPYPTRHFLFLQLTFSDVAFIKNFILIFRKVFVGNFNHTIRSHQFLYKHLLTFQCIFKTVYNGHPWDLEKVTIWLRCSSAKSWPYWFWH